MNRKVCFKCGIEKSISEFYCHGQMGDGFLGKCKECTCADVRENRRKRISYYRSYDRARAMREDRVRSRQLYAQTEAGKLGHKLTLERQRSLHPDKYAARTAVGNAIRDGRLLRCPCEVCGAVKAEAHHDDYSKPLDVRWLCVKHHRARHRELRAIERFASERREAALQTLPPLPPQASLNLENRV